MKICILKNTQVYIMEFYKFLSPNLRKWTVNAELPLLSPPGYLKLFVRQHVIIDIKGNDFRLSDVPVNFPGARAGLRVMRFGVGAAEGKSEQKNNANLLFGFLFVILPKMMMTEALTRNQVSEKPFAPSTSST